MRCTKCGYDGAGNVPGGTCIKCGTRLNINAPVQVMGANQISSSEVSDSRPTMIGVNVPTDQNLKATRIVGALESISSLKKTVVQGAVPGLGGQLKQTVVQNAKSSPVMTPLPNESGELTCPECGYPLADHYSICPNCGADFSGESEDVAAAEEQDIQANEVQPAVTTSINKKVGMKRGKVDSEIQGTVGLSSLKQEGSECEEDILCTCEKCGEEISATFLFCPKCGTEIRQKTINGFWHKKRKEAVEEVPQPTVKREFQLTIVPEEDENIEPVTNRFEGTEVILNRKNTEPENRTITSKEQAVIFSEQGKWFIENRSEYNSTLILANRKMEIQDGDIVMLGDRRFKFESEESKQN